MKPASVAALKELQEKLAFWSTWEETKAEWDSLFEKWIYPASSATHLSPANLRVMKYRADSELNFVGFINMVEKSYQKTDQPVSETAEQAWKDFIAQSQEMRRLAETLQRLSSTVASEAKQFSTILSEILAEIGGGDA